MCVMHPNGPNHHYVKLECLRNGWAKTCQNSLYHSWPDKTRILRGILLSVLGPSIWMSPVSFFPTTSLTGAGARSVLCGNLCQRSADVLDGARTGGVDLGVVQSRIGTHREKRGPTNSCVQPSSLKHRLHRSLVEQNTS